MGSFYHPSTLPLRSEIPARNCEYVQALSHHYFEEQTPLQYKPRWQKNVLDRASNLTFTQDYLWPTRYYWGNEDTMNLAPPREVDKYLGAERQSTIPWSSGGPRPKKHPIQPSTWIVDKD